MPDFPEEYRRPLIPNGCRRAPWHDYRGRSIYLITLNASPGLPAFSVLQGVPGDHDRKPRAVPTHLGEIIATNISKLKVTFPFTSILRRVIMPDHIHFVIFVKESTDIHLGEIIRHLKKHCTLDYKALVRRADQNPDDFSVFEDTYHDRILLKAGQLEKILKYVSDNPRRRLVRKMYPSFHRIRRIRHEDGREFDIYGNPDLLGDPDLEAVKVSRKYSPAELVSRKRRWKITVENCGVLVSPFISVDERKVYSWAIANGGRVIVIINNGFGPCFTPKGIQHELISEGRMLLVGPVEYSYAKKTVTRAECQSMNQLATDIAAGKLSRFVSR